MKESAHLCHLPERASHSTHKTPLALHIRFQIFRTSRYASQAVDGFHPFLLLRLKVVTSES